MTWAALECVCEKWRKGRRGRKEEKAGRVIDNRCCNQEHIKCHKRAIETGKKKSAERNERDMIKLMDFDVVMQPSSFCRRLAGSLIARRTLHNVFVYFLVGAASTRLNQRSKRDKKVKIYLNHRPKCKRRGTKSHVHEFPVSRMPADSGCACFSFNHSFWFFYLSKIRFSRLAKNNEEKE